VILLTNQDFMQTFITNTKPILSSIQWNLK
jgi:hypothetical protein